MSLEERVASVRKELEVLEERLKEEAHYKPMYEELKVETEAALSKAEADTAELKRRLQDSEKWVEEFKQQGVQLQERLDQLAKERETLLEKLSEANASSLAFKNLLRPIITELIEEQFTDALKETLEASVEPHSRKVAAKVMEDLRKGDIPQELAHRVVEILSTQEIKVTKVLGDFTLEVDRTPLTAEQATMRGKFMRMLLDGFCDNPTTVPKMVTWLNSQFPLSKTDRTKTEAEANYFTEQEILRHEVRSDGTHFYNLRPTAKERLHLVEKEAKA